MDFNEPSTGGMCPPTISNHSPRNFQALFKHIMPGSAIAHLIDRSAEARRTEPPPRASAQEIEMTAMATTRVSKDNLLKLALTAFGVIFLLIYPMGLIWPSGWVWHRGHGEYYLQMICGIYAVLGVFLILAARDPSEHRSLISFTIWSSIVHAAIMAAQALHDGQELGHLVGDVPALVIVAAVLWYLSPNARLEPSSA